MEKNKEIIFSVFFIGAVIFSLSLFLCFAPKEEYSISERRKLKELPQFSSEGLKKGELGKELEEYTLDHFPFREEFRGLKNLVSQGIFRKLDQGGLYHREGYLVKMEYPLNGEMLEYGSEKLLGIYEKYLKDSGSRCYLSLIPDKNYFLGEKYGMLTIDYELMFRQFSERLPFAKYLDITGLLGIEDYYKTDTHWRQEQLLDVAKYLGKEMGAEVEAPYDKIKAEKPFAGVYAGQWSLPVEGEDLYYLTNGILDNCRVYSVGEKNNTAEGIYDRKKLEDKDPYEMFLSGNKAILVIENPAVREKKELLVFRDSFASSLVPLLVPGYSKITLVDIRYVQSNILDYYIDFSGQDVLFLYSSLILNQSRSFK
ncbi:MAG: hypothetical protein IKW28_08645 [Lachnospiraceae bacterium]|nr:hypothetical protein [Lachnospiraceae bacterium]